MGIEAAVWGELVGQSSAVKVLAAAADAAHRLDGAARSAMTHAWLITGPPGSGRSNAARAFAAALMCAEGGCGECLDCRTTLSGAHPDVTVVATEMLSIGVDQMREVITKASMSPTTGTWQIIVVEDADRITDQGADALLKSLEEPPPSTVWMLCAPTPDDVIVTIRSRTRKVALRTPMDRDVAALLVRRDGIDETMAAHAARAAQGHIGRARGLARSEEAREERRRIMQVPGLLTSVGACLRTAEALVAMATADAERRTGELDARELAELKEALGFGTKGTRPKQAQAALKDLEDKQKARVKRLQRDALDRVLTELTTWYRDVLSIQLGVVDAVDDDTMAAIGLINAGMRERIRQAAECSTPEQTIAKVDALLEARTALEHSVAPLLAMEALLIRLGGFAVVC